MERYRKPEQAKGTQMLIFNLFQESDSEWSWRLITPTGRILAESGETYPNKKACRDAIDLVKTCDTAQVHDSKTE